MPFLLFLFAVLAVVWIFVATWLFAIVAVGALIWYLVTLDWKKDGWGGIFWLSVFTAICVTLGVVYSKHGGTGVFLTFFAMLMIFGMFDS